MPRTLSNRQEESLICIVEDDRATRESLQVLVSSLGYVATVFDSGEAFLSSGLLHTTTCLLSDVQMPGLSGLELQARLIADGFDIQIIFVTGHANDAEKARALRAGAISVLIKPVDQNALVDCLQRAHALATDENSSKQSASGLRRASG